MISKELENWIHTQNKKLEAKFGHNNETKLEGIYARVLKLNEEVGELCEEVLATNNDQREDKLAHKTKDDLAHEVADVLICTLLIADAMHVDPNKALENKIKKINTRFQDVTLS